MNHRRALLLSSIAFVLGSVPGAALAEMYRCVSPDGRVTFTDNASACPGAQKHEAFDRVQTLSSDPTDPAPPPAAPASERYRDAQKALDDDRAQKQHWQQKKHAAEEELRALEARQTRLTRVVTGCNRGAEIITRDSTGIKYKLSCDEIRREHDAAEEQAEELRAYLASGLRRECREAGCLPGWIS
jgi:hypothetical protein